MRRLVEWADVFVTNLRRGARACRLDWDSLEPINPRLVCLDHRLRPTGPIGTARPTTWGVLGLAGVAAALTTEACPTPTSGAAWAIT